MYPESDFKEIDQDRRKIFELNQNGEDELVILIPFSCLKTFHYCLNLLLEKNKVAGMEGYYITHRGTFKEQVSKYKAYSVQKKPDEKCILKNGSIISPIVTLKDGYGGISHIIEDDHCYVLINGSKDRGFVIASHWYPEALNALRMLPNLEK